MRHPFLSTKKVLPDVSRETIIDLINDTLGILDCDRLRRVYVTLDAIEAEQRISDALVELAGAEGRRVE